MAEAPKKNILDKSLEFIKDHWGEMFALWHMFWGGRSSRDVPDHLKDAVSGLQGRRRGSSDPLDDERYLKRLVDTEMNEDFRPFFIGWLAYEFPIQSRDPVKRKKAEEALEDFRLVVCGMDREPTVVGKKTVRDTVRDGNKNTVTEETTDVISTPPTRTLNEINKIGERVKNVYEVEVNKLDHTPSPTEDRACKRKAYKQISEENRAMGAPHMPTANEPHWTDHLSQLTGVLSEIPSQAQDAIRITSIEVRRFNRYLKSQRPKKGPRAWIRAWIS